MDNKNYSGLTSELGEFSKFMDVNDDLEYASQIKVIFEGDLHFKKTESLPLEFRKIRHTTKIDLDSSPGSTLEVEAGKTSSLKGRLMDIDFKKGISKRKIIMSNREGYISSVETDDYGCFEFKFNLPNFTWAYNIELRYEGDRLLKPAVHKSKFNIKEKQQSSFLSSFFEFAISRKDFSKMNKESEHKNYIALLLF